MTTTATTMFEKIGGKEAVEAVVDDFYQRIVADAELAPFFADTDMDQQRRHQVAFVAMALGGPRDYAGKNMRPAHEGRGIQESHFGAVAGHLVAALQAAGVAENDVSTIIGVVAGLKDDVVEV